MAARKRKRVSHPVGGEKVTDESQAPANEVNTIVRQFIKTGLMPQKQGGRYEDISSYDYIAMRNFIADKEALFGGLSARVRARFGGDPYNLLRFVENPANRDEAIKLGLVDIQKTAVEQATFNFRGNPDQDGGETPLHEEEAVRADKEANPVPSKTPPKGGKPKA